MPVIGDPDRRDRRQRHALGPVVADEPHQCAAPRKERPPHRVGFVAALDQDAALAFAAIKTGMAEPARARAAPERTDGAKRRPVELDEIRIALDRARHPVLAIRQAGEPQDGAQINATPRHVAIIALEIAAGDRTILYDAWRRIRAGRLLDADLLFGECKPRGSAALGCGSARGCRSCAFARRPRSGSVRCINELPVDLALAAAGGADRRPGGGCEIDAGAVR